MGNHFALLLLVVFGVYCLAYRLMFDEIRKSLGSKILAELSSLAVLLVAIYGLYNEQQKTLGEVTSIWYPIILTGIMWGVGLPLKVRNYTAYFKASEKKQELGWFRKEYTFKKTKDVLNDRISTYPRVTIFEWRAGEKKTRELIFDSSDFEVINKSFDTFNEVQPYITVGASIKLNNLTFNVEKVVVDFLCIFDDYSYGKTEMHSGEKIPYNVQVTIDVTAIGDH